MMGPIETELRGLPSDCSLGGLYCLLSEITAFWLLMDCCARLDVSSVLAACTEGRLPELITEAIEAAGALGI